MPMAGTAAKVVRVGPEGQWAEWTASSRLKKHGVRNMCRTSSCFLERAFRNVTSLHELQSL